MKILFFIDDLGSGGAQRQLVNLAIQISTLGNDVDVLSYSGNNYYRELLEQSGISCKLVEEKRAVSRLLKVRREIRNGNYKAVIAFLGVPVFIAELAGLPFRRWKMIAGERSANPVIARSLKSRFMRLFHFSADYVVSNSYANQELVKKVNPFLASAKLKVIYNTIDLEKFRPAEDFQFMQDNKLNIVVPASYRRLKNLTGLIEAVNLLRDEEKSGLQIDWYGDKTPNKHPQFVLPEAEALIEKYRLHKVIALNDVEPAIENIIRQADAIGLFSFFEGLPNTVCEGMACGKPVIASAVSDVPLLIEDQTGGILCDPVDVSSITGALRSMLNCSPEKMQQMGQYNREKAEKLFDENKIVEEYLQLIK